MTFFKQKSFVKKLFSIMFKIVVAILILITVIRFIQEARGVIQYNQRKTHVKTGYMTNISSKKYDEENYILINKRCANCVNNRKLNAGCVVAQDNKILLVKYRRTNQLSLPGGFRDYQHRDTFIATEEMRTAVGYVVSIEDIIGDFESFFSNPDNAFRLYRCRIVKKTRKTNNKILEEKWVSKKELKEILNMSDKEVAFKDELRLIYDKFEFLTKE